MFYQTSSVMLVFNYFTIVLVGSDIKLKALAEFQERVIIQFYTLPKDNNLFVKAVCAIHTGLISSLITKTALKISQCWIKSLGVFH